MGKREDEAERNRIAQQQQTTNAAHLALAQKASEPSALTKTFEEMMQKRLNFFNQGSPNYDMSQTDKEGKPLFPGGPIFADAATRQARAKRESERTGTGAIAMGSFGANPGQLAQLKEQRVRQSSQDASLDAADAVNVARAETFGSVLPLQNSRTQGYSVSSGAFGSLGSNLASQRAAIPKATPWWQTALGVAAPIAGSFATGGLSSLLNRPR